MVPQRFVFVSELPYLASGKVDAARLLQGLEDAAVPSAAAPAADALTQVVADIWAEALRIPRPPIDADFFALGGDSLALVEVFAAIEMRFGRHVTVEHLDASFTVARLSQLLDSGVLPISTGGVLVPLQPQGFLPPLYFVHAIGGSIGHLPGLAAHLGVKRPFFAVRATVDLAINLSIERMGEVYAEAIRERHAGGPLHIAGYSIGGVIAYETARRLIAAGYPVASLSVIDQRYPGARWRWRELGRMAWRDSGRFPAYFRWWAGKLSSKSVARIVHRWGRFLAGRAQNLATVIDTSALAPEIRRTGEAHLAALRQYRPEPCALRIAVYRARNRGLRSLLLDDSLGWSAVASGSVISRETPGDHVSMISEPQLAALAAELSKGLVMMDASAQTLPTCGVSADAVTMRSD
jgi:thioesterase domain-containing protein/acyl carrier protein